MWRLVAGGIVVPPIQKGEIMICRNMTRRDFLTLPAAAAVSATIHSAFAATPFSMPGLYPGRVVGVKHAGASINLVYQTAPIQSVLRRGMMELTGSSNFVTAWRKLFQPGDVVGIKVNPSGGSAVISSPACLLEVIQGLLLAGVAPKDIIVYERYQSLLDSVRGWLPSWVRTAYASPGGYTDDQTSITGYDPNYYVYMPQYLKPWQNPNNPADTRSYAALVVTRQVTKIISLTVLKDHQASGVTLNLKNLAGGCFNNWNRFHDNGNHMLEAIPAVVSLPVVRNKVVLGIIDGVHGLCNGGPINYADPKFGFVWENNTIYLSTDIVAADRVGWRAIDAERARRGMLPEELAGNDGYDLFAVRQPQHITIAGQMGLGEWRDERIDFRQIVLA
jgi:hypothetical protein